MSVKKANGKGKISKQQQLRTTHLKNIQKVNNTFYGTLKANIMNRDDYNKMFNSGQLRQSRLTGAPKYSNPSLIDPRQLIGNM